MRAWGYLLIGALAAIGGMYLFVRYGNYEEQ